MKTTVASLVAMQIYHEPGSTKDTGVTTVHHQAAVAAPATLVPFLSDNDL